MKAWHLLLFSFTLSSSLGLLGVYSVASEPFAYVAGMTYSVIFLVLLIPSVIVMFVATIAAASLNKGKYAAAFFVSCLMLPISFLGGMAIVKANGLARYDTPGANDMRPIDEEPNGNIVVVYTENSTFNEQEELSRRVIHPWKSPEGFTGETGVQATLGLGEIDGKVAEQIFFAASASEQKKNKLRSGLDASPIVFRYFENMNEWQVRKQFETKKTSPSSPERRK